MKPINTITGSLAPLPRANVDTDQIMPKKYLKRVERTGYGEFVFAEWKAADPELRPQSPRVPKRSHPGDRSQLRFGLLA